MIAQAAELEAEAIRPKSRSRPTRATSLVGRDHLPIEFFGFSCEPVGFAAKNFLELCLMHEVSQAAGMAGKSASPRSFDF
jgi:hypothetical protein